MDINCKVITVLIPLLVVLCPSLNQGQQVLLNGFMPGVAPSSPNQALQDCQSQATPNPKTRSYNTKHARILNSWCSIYDDVLPCLDRSLDSVNRASDWFLKLIYNESMATRMSQSICQRLPYLHDLRCVDEGMDRVVKCMNWTNSVKEHFYSQFIPARPMTPERKEMATVYACIISVTTASCYQRELTTCSVYQRKLMYDYYIMLSGRCREVAGIPETTTEDSASTSSQTLGQENNQTTTTPTPSPTARPDVPGPQRATNSSVKQDNNNRDNTTPFRPIWRKTRSKNGCASLEASLLGTITLLTFLYNVLK